MFTPGALFFKLVYLPLLYLTERFRNAMKVKKNTPPLNLGGGPGGVKGQKPLSGGCVLTTTVPRLIHVPTTFLQF